MKNIFLSQLYLKKGYYFIFLLTSWVFNTDLFVEFVLKPSPYYLCETNKDCLSSQNLFANRPLVGKSSYTLAVALLNNLRSEIRIDFMVSASKQIGLVNTCTNQKQFRILGLKYSSYVGFLGLCAWSFQKKKKIQHSYSKVVNMDSFFSE